MSADLIGLDEALSKASVPNPGIGAPRTSAAFAKVKVPDWVDFRAFIGIIRRVLTKAAESDLLPEKEDFLEYVGEMFDKYVGDVDVPAIPNFVEPLIDAQLRESAISIADKWLTDLGL